MPYPKNRLLVLALGCLSLVPLRAAPLRVGLDVNGAPMTFVDSKGVPRGFSVDIMNHLAAEMGIEITYFPKPWADMLADFRAGKTDAIANITYTDQRAQYVEFSVPNIVMNGAIFVRKSDPPLKTLSDLRDRRVAVKIGGSTYEYLLAHGWANHIVSAPTLLDSLRLLAEGNADAAMDARIIGLMNIRDEHLTTLEVSDVPVMDFAQRLHIGLHPGDTARLAMVNEGLARLRANGAYDRIYEKWIDPLDPHRLRLHELRPYLLPAAALAALIVGAFLWQRTLLRNLRETQTKLEREEAQFRFIYEHAPVGISWVKGGDARTRVVNQAHERITGVPQALSHDTNNYVAASHPDDRDAQQRLHEQVARGEIDQFVLEKRYVHPDGKLVWAMLSLHVYRDPDGGGPEELTTLVDISSLKRMEEERQQLQLKMVETQKLESLGVLAGGIAHDFNNLLTVIIANANLIRVTDEPVLKEEHLTAVETAGQRATELCRQLLTYAGRGRYVAGAIGVSELVQETAKLLEVSISKKARLVLLLSRDLPCVLADASQIRQVVMNLVINASDALGDASGEVRVSTYLGRFEVSPGTLVHSFAELAGDSVCLEVSDTGQGMNADTLRRIFEPFFTTKFTGRGLGLAAVLGIVRACRGTLAVESVPGRGTTFRLYLPAAAGPASASPGARPAVEVSEAGEHRTILVADDEPEVLATVENVLRHHGYQTVAARNGQEAVERFAANPDLFAAVVLDLTMPGLDGAEALRKIRLISPKAPVLLMSGYSSQSVTDRLQGMPRIEFLQKPFTRTSLLAGLAKTLACDRALAGS
jgi:two-component system cell cycle sensor histidine kinase/response regulator CckA